MLRHKYEVQPKKTLGFVQPNFQQGPKELSAYYLPYTAGVLLSYCMHSDQVRRDWQIGAMIWQREPMDQALAKIKSCDLVGFSTYVWNHRYNYELARRLKAANPDCVVVFGGPEPAITDNRIFIDNPYMDVIVKLEGERSLRSLLETDRDQWCRIPGVLINCAGSVHDTGDADRIDDLDHIPSPYLTGIFDGIMAENPHIEWNATLETNRGCPYQCTFCDWGSLTYNKVKKFALERVFAELDWIGEHCGFVTITDANFGMFVERDNLIIDKLIEVQQRWGRLRSFSMTWAKNQRNEVVDMVKKLVDQSPNFAQGLTVSVQSMDNDVLENIRRRNLDQHKIDEIFAVCDRKNIPVYTEVILGLPGETAESWRENFWRIFRAGNHTGINILQAQMLENAEMNLFQKKLWRLDTVPVYDYMSGSQADEYCPESVDVVISTRHIDADTMLDLLVWNTMIQTFHINGMTNYLSRFLVKYLGIDYSDFYQRLERHIMTDPWISQELAATRSYFQNWTRQGRAGHPDIGKVQVFGWNLVHRITLLIHQQRRMGAVQAVIDRFVRENFDLDPRLHHELMLLQTSYAVDYQHRHRYPMIQRFQHDFLGYLQDDSDLGAECEYRFEFNEDHDMTLDRFLENIYFARKRNFGKAAMTKSSVCSMAA